MSTSVQLGTRATYYLDDSTRSVCNARATVSDSLHEGATALIRPALMSVWGAGADVGRLGSPAARANDEPQETFLPRKRAVLPACERPAVPWS